MDSKQAVILRAKKLGILIRDARISAGKSKKEAGLSIGVSSATINSIETGKKSPSLPELELLSYYLNVPIEHFWLDEIHSDDDSLLDQLHVEHALTLRDRFIGKILFDAREKKNIPYKEIKIETGISAARMKKYESGEGSISMPELEILCTYLEIPISRLNDASSQIGRWLIEKSSTTEYLRLPLEVQEFVSQRLNKPYLDIALRLSKLGTTELRQLAESLLEITI
ncbi:MAG: helix-turn-helix domain-containing protein [Chloroflexota bacterium]